MLGFQNICGSIIDMFLLTLREVEDRLTEAVLDDNDTNWALINMYCPYIWPRGVCDNKVRLTRVCVCESYFYRRIRPAWSKGAPLTIRYC